jgi:8-amino-7-oxononanoate synthase
MRDRSHPLELLRQAASGRAAGLCCALVPRGPNLDGRARDGLLDLASNDYLGPCGDERLNAAAAEAARVWGTGSIDVPAADPAGPA